MYEALIWSNHTQEPSSLPSNSRLDLRRAAEPSEISIVSFSLFVLLKGATKEQAFSIGKDIVDTVTAMNPKPVKLKFEKVCLKASFDWYTIWFCDYCSLEMFEIKFLLCNLTLCDFSRDY